MILQIPDLESLPVKVSLFLKEIGNFKIVLLYGEMGMGKTTFTQEVLRQMGILHLEGSPTYSLINEYQSEKYGNIFHLDLYRLKSEMEAFDIGIEEILDGSNFCFIEWPEKIEKFVDFDHIIVEFCMNENQQRELKVTKKAV